MKNTFYSYLLILVALHLAVLLPGQYSFSFTNGQVLVDQGTRTITHLVNIPEEVNKLSVSIGITHSWVNDLEMRVINPDGQSALLFSRLGNGSCFGCGGDDLQLHFFDAADKSYDMLNEECGDLPAYSGDSQPLESLDALLTADPNGEWTVEITDVWPYEEGMVNEIVFVFELYSGPDCTNLVTPIHGADQVPVNTLISWEAVAGAESYLISLGTESGHYDILDKLDVGNVTSYDPELLACGTSYFVLIQPYNEFGEAGACSEEYFTTDMVDASVSGDVSICRGESTVLSASGGSFYVWMPIDYLDDPFSSAPTCSAPESMQYSAIVYDDFGCADTISLFVTVNHVDISVDSVGDVRTGIPGFIHISLYGGSGNYEYAWTGPDGFSSGQEDIDELGIGCFELRVTDMESGCMTDTVICVLDLTRASWLLPDSGLQIFPNPVKDHLYLDMSQIRQGTMIRITDMAGRIWREFEMNTGQSVLNMPVSLPPGTYELVLATKESTQSILFQVVP